MLLTPEITTIAPPLKIDRSQWIAVSLLLLVAWFGFLELRGLFAPDEGRYAQIPQAMVATGDWVTPRLNGFKYFEKPPLQYWATAVAFKVFGESEWSARLWPALTGFLGALVIGWAGARTAGLQVGFVASFIVATSLAYFMAGQYLTLDMGLSFFFTSAVAFFIIAQHEATSARSRTRWMLLVWAALAAATLSKGLIGIVLPGLAIGLYIALARDFRLIGRLAILPGTIVFLAIAAPWFVFVQDRNPEFLHFFFVREHFERFTLPEHRRPGPWWYFIPILVIGTLPWTPMVLGAMWRSLLAAIRQRAAPERSSFNIDLLLLVWVATVFVFFSVSRSKLPAYILPILPPLALLAARQIANFDARTIVRSALWSLATSVVLAVVGVVLVGRASPGDAALIERSMVWLYAAFAASIGGGIAAALVARRGNATIACVVLGLSTPITVLLATAGIHTIDEIRSSRQIVQSAFGASPQRTDTIPFYSVDTFDHSVPFYLGRPVIMVAHRSELREGIAADPGKFIESVDAFANLWRARTDGFAFMTHARYDQFERERLPMRIVARDAKRLIVSR
ncbi:MAG: phospholipid carrier-dependent glycosyltransferase [Burkholderiales bacterium]